ncbi:MAG: hypothetical protein HFF20_08055 [Oscillospiraceae bacterium]|jgi:hypothetical protein|nr:hypothetical protein [Oscillospiraceae bacterium]MCI9308303.1 hypothetical protein [Oscillospiraceae bacterium]MCI9549160.1 hypothetical protein [Oscillospiraceae bacterium]
MKLWKRAGSVGLSLALCAGLVLPALAHTVTIVGEGSQEVGTVQEGVTAIENSVSGSGTITMTNDDIGGATISGGNVTLDLNGHTLTSKEEAGIEVSGGELTLKDSGTGGKVSGNNAGVTVDNGSKANITGGTVSGMDAGVKVDAGGTANITGGTVTGNMSGVEVYGGTATISGGTVSGNTFGVFVVSGTATISGGTVSGDYFGVSVGSGGTADISGNASISGSDEGVFMVGGTAEISGAAAVQGGTSGVSVLNGNAEIKGGAVSGETGVVVSGGKAEITGGSVRGETDGVAVQDGTAAISGGTVSGKDKGVVVVLGGKAEITDGSVSGETGVHMYYGTFTMNGGTVGSMVEGGNAIDIYDTNIDKIAIELNGGTLYGEVPDGVNTDNVTVKDAPFDSNAPGPDPDPGPDPAPNPDPDPDPAPASDPLARPAAARTLLEELFRRAGGSGDLWSWAVENGLVDEDGDGGELVTVALLRAILTRYVEAFGGNAVAVEELTTLTGEDPSVVDNCRAVLNEFFGE